MDDYKTDDSIGDMMMIIIKTRNLIRHGDELGGLFLI